MSVGDWAELEIRLEYLRRRRKGFCRAAMQTCEGDLVLACNALMDYARICEEYIERERDSLNDYQVETMRCQIGRYRAIAEKYMKAMGYDREKAMRKCEKQRASVKETDVGEDALAAAIRAGTERDENRRKT